MNDIANLELDDEVPILRASKVIQDRIEELLNKQHQSELTQAEEKELNQYENLDNHLSLINRLSRNLTQTQD